MNLMFQKQQSPFKLGYCLQNLSWKRVKIPRKDIVYLYKHTHPMLCRDIHSIKQFYLSTSKQKFQKFQVTMSTDKASPKKIVMFSDRTSLNIIFSISVLLLEVCSPVSPLSYALFLRLHILFWYLLATFFMMDPTESMSKSEKPEAAAVTEEIVYESDESEDAVSETKYDELHDQQYFENLFVQSFLFKVRFD